MSLHRCGVSAPDGEDVLFEEPRKAATALAEFITDSIVTVLGEPDGKLTLSFAKAGTVTLYDSAPHYECYVIRHGETFYAV